MAYQEVRARHRGDGAVVRAFAERVGSFLVSTSFSKSLHRTWSGSALSVVRADVAEAARVLSQLKIVIRTNYPNRPRTVPHRGDGAG